jgi:hypothetical protein
LPSTTDLVVDIVGYFPAGSPVEPIPPFRAVDTRPPSPRRLDAGGTIDVQVAGVGGVPATATSVIVNVAAVAPSGNGFATVYPCDRPVPTAATVTYVATETRPALTVAKLDANGRICVYASQSIDVVVDVAGFVPATAGGYAPLPEPSRLVDTREGRGLPQLRLPAGVPQTIDVRASGLLPAGATTVAVNASATEARGGGFATLYPCAATPPTASLNYVAGRSTSNFAAVGLSPQGTICVLASSETHFVIDVVGSFVGTTEYTPLAVPDRLVDTRWIVEPRCGKLVYPPSGTSVVVRDLYAGTDVIVSSPVLATATTVVMGAGCDNLIAAFEQGSVENFARIGFDGSTQTFPGLLGRARPVITVTDDGRLIASAQSTVWDIATRTVLYERMTMSNSVGVTADGTYAVFESASILDDAITYVDIDTRVVATSFDSIPHWGTARISPTGGFVAYAVPSSATSDDIVVTDSTGTVLDVLPLASGSQTVVRWLSDDTIIVCPPGQRAGLWKLHSDVLAPVPGAPRNGCPTGA